MYYVIRQKHSFLSSRENKPANSEPKTNDLKIFSSWMTMTTETILRFVDRASRYISVIKSNKNQLDALFILSLFRQSVSTFWRFADRASQYICLSN